MSDGSGLPGRSPGPQAEAREEAEGTRAAPEGGTPPLSNYLRQREEAQQRKIELSMMRKRGFAPSADPQDRAFLDSTPQRTDSRYDPRKW